MIAATAALEFVSTATETELLLEANLINGCARASTCCCASKSCSLHPTGDRAANLKHRGAQPSDNVQLVGRRRQPHYHGAAGAPVLTAPTAFESRTRPCLLFRIGATAPARADHSRISAELVTNRSCRHPAAVRLAVEMEKARPRSFREPPRSATAWPRCRQCRPTKINPRSEADVFRCTGGGFGCVEVFFFGPARTGASFGPYFRADRSFSAAIFGRVPQLTTSVSAWSWCPTKERALLAEALTVRAAQGRDFAAPPRREEGPRQPRARHARGAGAQARRLTSPRNASC